MTLLFTIGIVNISRDTESLYIISLCIIYLNPAAQSWSKACSSIVCLRKYRDVYLKETSIKSNIVKLNWYQKIEFIFIGCRVMKIDISYLSFRLLGLCGWSWSVSLTIVYAIGIGITGDTLALLLLERGSDNPPLKVNYLYTTTTSTLHWAAYQAIIGDPSPKCPLNKDKEMNKSSDLSPSRPRSGSRLSLSVSCNRC